MKITYLGHAAFELEFEGGVRLVLDPYESGSYDGALKYEPIEESYDIAVVSHRHPDHCCKAVLDEAVDVVDAPGEHRFGDVTVTALATFHDESKGSERGGNLVTIVEAEGLRLAHLGDLGHMPTDELLERLEGVDVLFVPVGGFFTIDAAAASAIAGKVAPGMIIPMHFKTDRVDFPIASVDNFLALMENVERPGGSEVEVETGRAGGAVRVVVLEPAL